MKGTSSSRLGPTFGALPYSSVTWNGSIPLHATSTFTNKKGTRKGVPFACGRLRLMALVCSNMELKSMIFAMSDA